MAINGSRFKEAGFVRQHYVADIPSGVDLKTVLTSDYWKHVAPQLRPLDLIEAINEDGSWEAMLRVMYASPTEVKLDVIFKRERAVEAPTADKDSAYRIAWISPGAKFGVFNKDGNVPIKDHLYPKSAAYDYVKEHLREMRG